MLTKIFGDTHKRYNYNISILTSVSKTLVKEQKTSSNQTCFYFNYFTINKLRTVFLTNPSKTIGSLYLFINIVITVTFFNQYIVH